MTIKAYSYTRFSTPEQAAGDSARRQIQMAEDYAAKNGLVLDEALHLSDLGISAYYGDNIRRGALGAFLKAAEHGDVEAGSYLLVESLDRLSRTAARRAMSVLNDIVDAGITVVTLTDGQVYDAETLDQDPGKLLYSLVVMIRANDESLQKSRRIRAAWEQKRAGAGSRPLTSVSPAWLELEGGAFVLVEEKAAVVRRIVQMTLEGQGQHRIAETLNREAVPTFGRSRMWHRSYIKKMVESPALGGTLVPHEVTRAHGKRVRTPLEPVPGYFPAVISEPAWESLKALAGVGSRAPQQRRTGIRNVLAGLARCPQCGGTMTRVMKGPKGGRPKLVCATAKAGAGCRYRSVDLGQIEITLRADLDAVLAEGPSGNAVLDAEVADLRARLDAEDAAVETYLEEMRGRDGRSPALSAALAKSEIEKAKIEPLIREAWRRQEAATPAAMTRHRTEALEALENAHGGAEEDWAAIMNPKLRMIFERVIVDYGRGELRFIWKDGSESEVAPVFMWPQGDVEAVNSNPDERKGKAAL